MDRLSVRKALFQIGLLALALSIVDLVGIYVRPIRSTDYMKQFEDGLPWLETGLASSLFALIFGCFGKGKRRIAAMAGSLVLFAFWVLITGFSL